MTIVSETYFELKTKDKYSGTNVLMNLIHISMNTHTITHCNVLRMGKRLAYATHMP